MDSLLLVDQLFVHLGQLVPGVLLHTARRHENSGPSVSGLGLLDFLDVGSYLAAELDGLGQVLEPWVSEAVHGGLMRRLQEI